METNTFYPAMPTPEQTNRPARPRLEIGKGDLIFAAVLTALTLFGVAAGIWGGFRLGYAAAFCAGFAAVSVFIGQKKRAPGAFGILCGALALSMAPVFALNSNVVVRGCCVIAGAVLSVIWFCSLAGVRAPAGDLGLARLMGVGLTDAVGNVPLTLRSVFSPENPRMKGVSKVLLGVLCAVPVLCAVVPLLIRSDAAFDGLIGALFSDLGTVAAQLILTLFLTPFLLSFALSLRKTEGSPAAEKEGRGLDTAFLTAFLSVLSVVYVVYLCSQLAYFFDAFRGLLPAGMAISYADYARRGFFELCAVAGINLVLLFLTVFLARKKEGRLPVVLRVFGTFIVLFTLVLIGTALAKMALYIDNFGLTVLRLGTSAFMVFMAAVFLAVLARLFTARVRILHVAAVSAAVVLLALGLGNINAVVAKYNYDAYVTGRLPQIDVEYLSQLGPEGVPYLTRLMEREKGNADLRDELAEEVYYRYTVFYECEYDWDEANGYRFRDPLTRAYRRLSQFSLPQKNAYDALESFLQTYPDFVEKEGYGLGRAYAGFDDSYGYFTQEEPATAPPMRQPEEESTEPVTEEPSTTL